jgi:uncharacterized membrane protein
MDFLFPYSPTVCTICLLSRCVLAELFLEGQPLFELSQLLAYRRGQYDPMHTLEKVFCYFSLFEILSVFFLNYFTSEKLYILVAPWMPAELFHLYGQ